MPVGSTSLKSWVLELWWGIWLACVAAELVPMYLNILQSILLKYSLHARKVNGECGISEYIFIYLGNNWVTYNISPSRQVLFSVTQPKMGTRTLPGN